MPGDDERGARWPARLLTNGNRDLARDRIWTWSLPALAARLPDGSTVRTCPAAGICALACYAREGTYKIPSVRARHLLNLRYTIEDLGGWQDAMIRELAHRRFANGVRVRIHDGGDFYSPRYLDAWLTVIAASPHVGFYTYTKEVELFRRLVETAPPPNLKWVYSLGGKQDVLLTGADRIADVFPTESAIERSRFHSQAASDLLAVDGPSPVAMASNNIPKLKRRQGDRTFGQWQAETEGRAFPFDLAA
ncbi:MAG TPA: hypothetical protein VGX23_33285 [Actinocrinis sp.]|nr:hypothetical protein [Actinocrinis sp.]